MDFRQLRYFLVLAEECHFGRAARRLALSQPPLSHAIRQLEDELGTALFTRTTRYVALTPAGVALQREAQALLRRGEDIRSMVKAVAEGKQGRIRLGFVGTMVYRGLPQILKEYATKNPNVDVSLQELNSEEQILALQRGEIELGFIFAPARPNGLDGFAYHSEPFVACVPAGKLTASRPINLNLLAHEPFILFSRRVSPQYYELIIGTCVAAGFVPHVTHEVRHWLTVISLVAQGMGVALVPRTTARSAIADAVFLPIKGTTVKSETWCIWSKTRSLDPPLDRFLTLVRNQSERLRLTYATERAAHHKISIDLGASAALTSFERDTEAD